MVRQSSTRANTQNTSSVMTQVQHLEKEKKKTEASFFPHSPAFLRVFLWVKDEHSHYANIYIIKPEVNHNDKPEDVCVPFLRVLYWKV